ncbi:MAG: hypothetical protein R3F33_04210 [Planctomycetota bacterium]
MKAVWTSLLLVLPAACRSPKMPDIQPWQLGGPTFAFHEGPLVAAGEEGPRRRLQSLRDHWSHTLPEQGPFAAPWQVVEGPFPAWLRRGTAPGGPLVVVHIASRTVASRVAAGRAVAAWDQALGAGALAAAHGSVMVAQGPAAPLLEMARSTGTAPLAWVTVTEIDAGPAQLGTAPAPAGLPQGWTVLLRLGLVDAGLVGRPWRSVEQPAPADPFVEELSRAGCAFGILAVGDSGIDLSAGDAPELDEVDRLGLALWGAVLCVIEGRASDLQRTLASLQFEGRLHANTEGEEQAEAWAAWIEGARHWLRRVTLELGAGEVSAD